MALVLSIGEKSISADCKTLTVKDLTGNYDVTTNTGGYGTPNPARSTLYLKLLVTLKKTIGDEPQTVVAYDENIATEWAITIAEDGRYELFLFACDIYAAGTTYELNYIIYDLATDKFYYSVQGTNLGNAVTNIAWWLPATTTTQFIAAIDSAQATVYSDTYNDMVLCNSIICRNNKLLSELDCNCGINDESLVKVSTRLTNYINGVAIRNAEASYDKAQELIERLQDICTDVDCANC